MLAHGLTRMCLQPHLCEVKGREPERRNGLSQVPLNNPLLLPLMLPFPISVQLKITYAEDHDKDWRYEDQEMVPVLKESIV